MSPLVFIVWLVLGALSFVVLILLFALFGRLIKLQMKIWILAKKGYHMVEHIGKNKVRTYYYLKPKDNKFDFNDGFYLHIPETVTKQTSMLPGVGSLKKLDSLNDEEYKKLHNKIVSLTYDMDAVSLRWGIPTITYVGNSPSPVKFDEPEKVYGAQVIKDIYLRLLATQQFKKFMKAIIIGIFCLAGILVCLILLYNAYKSSVGQIGVCQDMLNSTFTQLVQCTNTTARILNQNSTVII